MSNSKKVKVFKLILLIIVLAIIVGAISYFYPFMKDLSTTEGQLAFKDKINNLGWKSVLVLLAIQVIQIFLVIIPGGPVEILAGMCYGTVWGTIFIIISSGLVSALIFFLVRKFGKKFIYAFCNKEQVDKIENSKMFQNPKKIEIIMLILFLIPGTPKDLLVYIAGLLPINPVRFIIISTIARIPAIIASTLGGAKLTDGNWYFTIISNVVVFIIAIIIVLIYNKFDKDKTAEEALRMMDDRKS